MLELQVCTTMVNLYPARNGIQGLMRARPALKEPQGTELLTQSSLALLEGDLEYSDFCPPPGLTRSWGEQVSEPSLRKSNQKGRRPTAP